VVAQDELLGGIYKTGLGFPDDVLIAQDVGGYDCFFSTERFNEARSEITAHSTWEYSGGCDLILANAGLRMNPSAPSRPEAYLDFSTALSVNLEKMKAEHAIDSVAGFFVASTVEVDGSSRPHVVIRQTGDDFFLGQRKVRASKQQCNKPKTIQR
jgi:hypothetical protein